MSDVVDRRVWRRILKARHLESFQTATALTLELSGMPTLALVSSPTKKDQNQPRIYPRDLDQALTPSPKLSISSAFARMFSSLIFS